MRTTKSRNKASKKSPNQSQSALPLFGRFRLPPGEPFPNVREAVDDYLHERWAHLGTRRKRS
jgi:hypothetical protein